MANRFWRGTTGAWSTAANWNTLADGSGSAGVPAAGDDVYFLEGSVSVTSGLSTGLTDTDALNSLTVAGGDSGYKGHIGTTSTRLDADIGTLTLGGEGSYHFSGDITTKVVVEKGKEAEATVSFSASNLTLLQIWGGFVDVGGAYTITKAEGTNGRLYAGADGTFTELEAAGTFALESLKNPATLLLSGRARVLTKGTNVPTLVTQDGGYFNHQGLADIPMMYLRSGAFSLKDNPYGVSIGGEDGVQGTDDFFEHWEGALIEVPMAGNSPVFVSPTIKGTGSVLVQGSNKDLLGGLGLSGLGA
jgi:hypothetical protein